MYSMQCMSGECHRHYMIANVIVTFHSVLNKRHINNDRQSIAVLVSNMYIIGSNQTRTLQALMMHQNIILHL